MEYDEEDDDIQMYQSRQQTRQGESRAQKASRRVPSGDTAEDDNEMPANNEGESDLSSSDELAVDADPRHPFYHYATEKADSFADAKVIYQRHRLDTKILPVFL
jgi:hypothetical protein